ncbi:hypothetical protein [Streptomyces sp. NBRC 110028]|uniref:hypothetical protein n=1 Tax=Streptomyces sp. NBRC 110028 TaxID=1621260 RepID=UPI0006E27F12|nr:hypothetical protein [Streptomyces sp. NBRC 110028]
MHIDWAALGQVFGVSLAVTVGVVGVFTLGIVGTSRTAQPQPQTTAGGASPAARTGAYACFALCAAVVAYGIYLIVA